MKTLIIYNSIHHSNTQRVAEKMAEVLGAKLAKPNEVNFNEIQEYDLIGFGSGIYSFKHHQSLFDFIDKLPSQNNQKAFIFSTSGATKKEIFKNFDKPLKDKLLKKGFKIIGNFNCPGWDTYPVWVRPFGGINKGRPNDKDIDRAGEFAKNLISDSQ